MSRHKGNKQLKGKLRLKTQFWQSISKQSSVLCTMSNKNQKPHSWDFSKHLSHLTVEKLYGKKNMSYSHCISYSYCISFLERGNIRSSISFLERTDWISTNSISYNYSTSILSCFLRNKKLHPSLFLFSFWHFASKHRVEPQAWNYKQNTTSKFPNKCLLIRGLGPSCPLDYL